MDPEEDAVDVTTLPEEPAIKNGRVVYESDVRAAADRGRGDAHILGPEVGPPDGPTEPDGGAHDHGGDGWGKRSPAVKALIATAYLGFGALLLYAGALAMKDAITEARKGKEDK